MTSYRRIAGKQIAVWGAETLEKQGFFVNTQGRQGTIHFMTEAERAFVRLGLGTQTDSTPVASRITEVKPGLRIRDRIRFWNIKETQYTVFNVTFRFLQAQTPAGLTENIGLWNCPLPSSAYPDDTLIPLTAAGISRSHGQYVLVFAHNFNLITGSGVYKRIRVPDWVDATQWHNLQVRLMHDRVLFVLSQGYFEHSMEISEINVASEKFAFEFSIDNDNFPHPRSPVLIPDQIDISSFDISSLEII